MKEINLESILGEVNAKEGFFFGERLKKVILDFGREACNQTTDLCVDEIEKVNPFINKKSIIKRCKEAIK